VATLKEMADAIALKRGGAALSAGSSAARAVGQATATSPQPDPDKPKTLAEIAAEINAKRGQSTGGSGGGATKGLDREVVAKFGKSARAAARQGVDKERIAQIQTGTEDPTGGLLGVIGKVVDFDVLGKVPFTDIDLPGSFKPIRTAVLKPLEVLDTGRRTVISGVNELVDLMPGGDNASFSDFLAQARDTSYGFGKAFANPTGNKWLDRAIGLTGDILLDPITYLTFGTGGFAKSAALGALKQGVKVGTKQTIKAASKEGLERGLRVVADGGKLTDDVARALSPAQRGAVEEVLKQQRVGARRTLGAKTREDLAQGARELREEAAEIAADTSGTYSAAVRANAEGVLNTLTDDVVSDLATRGYRAARGDVAEALGLRGGLRFGVGKAKVIIPGTERFADTAGAIIGGTRVGGLATKIPGTDIQIVLGDFVNTKAGKKILGVATPVGDGGVFGPKNILNMRLALRTGQFDGRKLTPKEGNEFVKLLAADKAFRTVRSNQLREGQQLINPALGGADSRTVSDLLDLSNPVAVTARTADDALDAILFPDVVPGRPLTAAESFETGVPMAGGRKPKIVYKPKVDLLDDSMTPERASELLGRPVTQAELNQARVWRKVGDEFYERANYLHQRAKIAAGIPLEKIDDLPKNESWFPHVLTERAKRGVRDKELTVKAVGADLLNSVDNPAADRSFALAGSNVRRLKAGEMWFGVKLTPEDVSQGVKRFNQIAREKGGLKYDIFETDADTAFRRYVDGWARDSAYTEWLFNMALATKSAGLRGTRVYDESIGLSPSSVPGQAYPYTRAEIRSAYPSEYTDDIIMPREGDPAAALFRNKGFQGLVKQEQVEYTFGVPVPSKISDFADAVTTILTPERVAALNTVEGFADEMSLLGDQIAKLADDIETKTLAGKGLFADALNETLNNFEQRLFNLQRLSETVPGGVPAGTGAAMSSEAAALTASLRNEADNLVVKLNSVDPEKWMRLVPQFLDNATMFLQLNSRNYPGLIASPEVAEMIKNFRRLEDPKFATAINNSLGDVTRMFKGWVTATPGFHLRNGISNVFFMLAAGMDPINIARATKIYRAYSNFLKSQNLDDLLGMGADETAEYALRTKAVTALEKKKIEPTEANIANWFTTKEGKFAQRDYEEALRIDMSRVMSEFILSPQYAALARKGGVDYAEAMDVLSATQYGFKGLIGDVFEDTGSLGISGRLNNKAGAVNSASRAAGKALGLSRSVGNTIENWSRFALTYDGIARGMSPEAAAARTAKYLIDYQDLSIADRNIKSIIPFWMWTSRSFPLIVESSWANPRAFAWWNSVTRNLTDEEGMEDQKRPYYLRSSFKLPFGRNIYGNPDFGYQKQDEAFASLIDPRSILSGLSPAIRAPIEAAMNQQFRTGQQIFSPTYDEGVREQLEYLVKNISGIGSATQRAANVVPGLLNLAGTIPGLGGLQSAAGALETAPVVGRYIGAPEYIEEEKGPQTTEASLQALYRFLGLPFYQLQPFQEESAMREQMKILDREAARKKAEREKERGR
jgi:hypothetical protein